MGLYNFQARFVPLILAGTKRHTIRAPRVHPDRPGNTLHLYTGLRRPGARLLDRVRCTHVSDIAITADGRVMVDGRLLSAEECEFLARKDGFSSHAEMMRFWRDGGRLPFLGHMIHW